MCTQLCRIPIRARCRVNPASLAQLDSRHTAVIAGGCISRGHEEKGRILCVTYIYQAKVEKRFAVHRESIHPAITPAVVYQQQRGKHGSFVVGWSYDMWNTKILSKLRLNTAKER